MRRKPAKRLNSLDANSLHPLSNYGINLLLNQLFDLLGGCLQLMILLVLSLLALQF